MSGLSLGHAAHQSTFPTEGSLTWNPEEGRESVVAGREGSFLTEDTLSPAGRMKGCSDLCAEAGVGTRARGHSRPGHSGPSTVCTGRAAQQPRPSMQDRNPEQLTGDAGSTRRQRSHCSCHGHGDASRVSGSPGQSRGGRERRTQDSQATLTRTTVFKFTVQGLNLLQKPFYVETPDETAGSCGFRARVDPGAVE